MAGMPGVKPTRLEGALATVIGLPVCLFVLAVTKLHFELFERTAAFVEQSSWLQRLFKAYPVHSSVVLLICTGAVAARGSLSGGPLRSIIALSGFVLSLVLLDAVLQRVGSFPQTVAGAVVAGEQSWVRFTLPCLRDKMQIALVHHMADLIFIVFTLTAVTLVLPGQAAWLMLAPAALIWLRANALWQEVVHIESHTRFLTPHKSTPRGLEKYTLKFLDVCSHWGLSQFFGMFPGWYKVEHIGMHHAVINSPQDVETVIYHDRSSFVECCALTGRILANTAAGLGMYNFFRAAGRRKYLRMTLIGVAARVVTITGFLWVCAPLGVWLLLAMLGFGFSMGMIALGDHGLTDPEDPTNVYRNSYNVRWEFGDCAQYGNRIHLSHHLRPAPSWGPEAARAALADEERAFAAEGTIVFRSFAYPDDLLRAYWNNDADFLYDYVITVGGQPVGRDEWRRVFHSRIRPAGALPPGPITRWISRCAARLAAPHIPPSSGDVRCFERGSSFAAAARNPI